MPLNNAWVQYYNNPCDIVSTLSCTCTHLPTGSIHGLLGGGIGVDGCHEPLNDAKLVVDHFCQRSKAVGGTGGVAREKGDN